MARLSYAVPLALVLTFAASCGSKSSSTPDAVVVKVTDAPPPIDSMPDALVCTAPEMMCTAGACTNVNTDEQNCLACGTVCQGGAYCKAPPTPDGCTCPGNFLPADLTKNVLDQHNVQSFGGTNIHIAVAPATGGLQINALVIVTAGIPAIDTNFTLKSGITPPIVLAAYNVQAGGTIPTADAEYEATAGTLRLSTATCDATGFEYTGTLSKVTFSGVTGTLPNVQVDPNGCTFTVDSMTFDIVVGDTANPVACTP